MIRLPSCNGRGQSIYPKGTDSELSGFNDLTFGKGTFGGGWWCIPKGVLFKLREYHNRQYGPITWATGGVHETESRGSAVSEIQEQRRRGGSGDPAVNI